jgi:late competence protein required for DNA uptake (superfamily II DNA/RNA helicase)
MGKDHPANEDRFHDKNYPCPHCGNTVSPFNKSLMTAKLNNQLFSQVERQQSEVSFAQKALREKAPR